jgi:hypothetical protein
LRRNCRPKGVIGGNIEGRAEVTEKRGRRCKRLLNDIKETQDAGNSTGSTRSPSVKGSPWKRLRICREGDFAVNECGSKLKVMVWSSY